MTWTIAVEWAVAALIALLAFGAGWHMRGRRPGADSPGK